MRTFLRVIAVTLVLSTTACNPFSGAKKANGDAAQDALDLLQALPGIPDGTAPCDPNRILPDAPASGPPPVIPPQAGPVSPASVQQAASAVPTSHPPVGQPPRPAPTTPSSPPAPTPAVTVGLPAAAHPTGDHKIYVSLGDSFSAGEGSPDYRTSCFDTGTDTATPGNHCHRSQEAYPVKVWESLSRVTPWSLTTVACSGGVMDDYYSANPLNAGEPPQRNALTAGADLVTLTMGGNDGGFASVLTWCIEDLVHPYLAGGGSLELAATGACGKRLDDAADDIARMTDQEKNDPPRPGGRRGHLLHDFYTDVRADAPKATVLVLGYQQFFPDDPPSRCSTGIAAGYFTRDMMLRFNQVVHQADEAIKKEATEAGLGYVDVENIASSTGNTLCQDDGKRRMQNRFIYTDYKRSFHPSISAHAEEAVRVLACVQQKSCGGEPVPNPPVRVKDLSGDVWAFGKSVDTARRTLSFDKIDWFEGAAATEACKQDHHAIHDSALCNDFYYRNNNTRVRTGTVTDAAAVTLQDLQATDGAVRQKPVGLPELASTIAARHPILILTIRDGLIVAVKEQFTP
jgi:hypothetical protein